jgi:ferredoxin
MMDDDNDTVVNMKCAVCGRIVPPFSGSLFLEVADICKLDTQSFASHLSELSPQRAEEVLLMRCLSTCPHIRPGSARSDAHWVANGRADPLFTQEAIGDQPLVTKLLTMMEEFTREQLVRAILRLFVK